MSSKIKICYILVLFTFFVASTKVRAEEKEFETTSTEQVVDDVNANEQEPLEEKGYSKGSLCGYCTYCKFCKLCDKDCPCEKSAGKPNCHMCKYCKFCYLCKLACETVCQPGGIIDVISTTIYNQLPRFDKTEVDKDLNDVKEWMEKVKHEL